MNDALAEQNWILRLSTAEDAPAVLDIYRPIVEETAITFELSCPTIEEMAQRITVSFNKHMWLVCTCNEAVIGYAYASDFRKRLAYRWITEASVYVRDAEQKRGAAYALYQALHTILTLQGYRKSMAVMTSPNPKSQGFHRRFGYQHDITWDKMGYKFNQWHGVEIMSLLLNDFEESMPEIIPISELDQDQLLKIFTDAVKSICL